jgi:hypothetical protein
MTRTVTERDFRYPEYRDANPEDYEMRDDGTIARKDRWEVGIRRISSLVGFGSRDAWEVDDIVRKVMEIVEAAQSAHTFSAGDGKE